MTDFVYPGAVHTRFHHALGAMHLMIEALRTLQYKGVEITDEECEGACAAILLHDIGHGPYSHALEHLISPIAHENISLIIMQKLNDEFAGRLDLAIDIFKGDYQKPFLHQLVSSQLDMDRMDYLTRDSFFTGVAEGVVGYDRIIKMLDVRDNRLVVEEKALYSIQKFLLARHFMYWQVYLHKTVLSTEIMLQRFYQLIEADYTKATAPLYSQNLVQYFENGGIDAQFNLNHFIALDDSDLLYTIKNHSNSNNQVIRTLAKGLKNRELFKLVLSNQEEASDLLHELRHKVVNNVHSNPLFTEDLIFTGEEATTFYSESSEEILILRKTGEVDLLSNIEHFHNVEEVTRKFYVCYPKALKN